MCADSIFRGRCEIFRGPCEPARGHRDRTAYLSTMGRRAASLKPAVDAVRLWAGVWALPALAVLLAAVLHAMAARSASGPVWAEDEIGPLANSYVISAVGEPWPLSKIAYYPGWSVVLAPIWWFTSDPRTAYHVAIGLSVAVAVLGIAPLAMIARRVGITTPVAVVVAAVITMSPARTVMSNYVLTENFLVLIFAVTAVAAIRYFERPTSPRALLLATTAVYTFFTHGRAIPVVIATLIIFGLAARRSPRSALVGVGATLVLAVVAYATYTGIVGQIYDSATGREDSALETISNISLRGLVRTVGGQLWYQLGAWLGLSVLGVLVVARTAATEIRRRRVGAASWATLTIVGLAALMSLFLGKVLADPSTVHRLDYWIYGRYLDPFAIPFAVVGLAAIVGCRRSLPVRTFAAASVGISVWFAVIDLRSIDLQWGLAVINPAGMLIWGEVFGAIPTKATVVTCLVVPVVIVLVARFSSLRARFLVLPLAAFFAVSALVVDSRVVDPFSAFWRQGGAIHDIVAEVAPDEATIAYDVAGGMSAEDNRATYALSPQRLLRFDSTKEAPPSEVVIARWDWPLGEALGAVRVGSLRFPNNAIWVLPGELQDELVAQGYAERPVDSVALRSYDYEVRIDDAPAAGASCGRPSAQCSVQLRITNLGADAWSPLDTLGGPTGSVRIVAWWQSSAAALPEFYELPRSVYPGETITLHAPLDPPIGIGTGPILVEFGLVQEGVGGFPGAEADLPSIQITAAD